MPSRGQALADARVVEDLGHGPAVRRRRARRRRRRSRRPTCAGCSGCTSRGRAVNTSRAKPSVSPMSRSSRSAMSVISSRVKPRWPFVGPGRRLGALQLQPGPRRRRTIRPNRLRMRAVSRGKRIRATSGIEASTPRHAGEHAPTANVRLPTCELVRRRPERPPRPAPAAVRLRRLLVGLLLDPVLWADHDRAERHEVGVGRAAVVHRDAVEPGGAERLAVRRDLLQVPAERLLALVEAASRPGTAATAACSPRGRAGPGRRGPGAERALVGEVEHAAALESRRTPRPRDELAHVAGGQLVQFVGRPAETWASWNTGNARCSTLGGTARRRRRRAQVVAQPAERAGVAERSSRPRAPARTVEQQPHRHELDEAPRRHRVGDAVAALLDLLDHPAPAAQRQQRRGEERVPLALGRRRAASSDSRTRFQRARSRRPGAGPVPRPARAASGRAARAAGGTARRSAEEALSRPRQRPVRERPGRGTRRRTG